MGRLGLGDGGVAVGILGDGLLLGFDGAVILDLGPLGMPDLTLASASQKHQAGKRNERGVDPTIPEAAADRVVELLVAHGGGTADAGVTKVGEAPVSPVIRISASLPARITGMEIETGTVVSCLEAIGCNVDGDEELVVVPPPWRRDLRDPFDLVEEVARIVGYDQVPSVVPPPFWRTATLA